MTGMRRSGRRNNSTMQNSREKAAKANTNPASAAPLTRGAPVAGFSGVSR
jgi:hypothetical protein